MISSSKVRGVLIAAVLAVPASGWAETGREAFARRDYSAAAALWRAEAAEGSADAKFGLGLISDLGLGAARDSATALRWYLEAADGGVADAQFNVAVMLDSGAGGARDVGAAAVWYARAAANGHARAQYNLALLYEGGEGLPLNPDLARHWYAKAAAALPAAQTRLAQTPPAAPETRVVEPPRILAGALVLGPQGLHAELAWAAAPGPEGAGFALEVISLGADGAGQGAWLETRTLDASAAIAALPDPGGAYAWRVSRVAPGPASGPARYAATPWQALGGAGGDLGDAAPKGRVSIATGAGDAAAERLAEELTAGLRSAGIWVTAAAPGDPAPASDVRFGYAGDADLANAIAAALPSPIEGGARMDGAATWAPGEIVVHLVGGPGEATPAQAPAAMAAKDAAPGIADEAMADPEVAPMADPEVAPMADPEVAPMADPEVAPMAQAETAQTPAPVASRRR